MLARVAGTGGLVKTGACCTTEASVHLLFVSDVMMGIGVSVLGWSMVLSLATQKNVCPLFVVVVRVTTDCVKRATSHCKHNQH